ncbi:hypothetical protein ACT4S5_05145 [Kocuria oceani]|uniref:hypothetical protein n=1 Tax=Kocuria oceani TaxID=988827 RepID=UPI004036C9F6
MSTSQDPDDVVPGAARSLRGTAVAATALAAVLLMGIGIGPAAADPSAAAGSTVAAAPATIGREVAERLAGIAEDLAEAVTHGEITTQQAERFLLQVHHRIVS